MAIINIFDYMFDIANYVISLFTDLATGNYMNFMNFLDGKYTFWLLTESEHLVSNMQVLNASLPSALATGLKTFFGVFHFFSNAIVPSSAPYVLHFITALIGWAAFTKAISLVASLFKSLK